MTDDRMALIELVEQQADGDLVREMLALATSKSAVSRRVDAYQAPRLGLML